MALNGGTAGSTELGNDGDGDLGRSVAGHDQPQHRVAGECHRTEGGRVVTLPEAERSFYFAALAQLEPARRPVFTERETRLLGAHPNPRPAARQALVSLWTPSAMRNSRGPRAGIALRRRAGRSALCKLRRACGLSVDSWGAVHELSIGDHVRN